MNWLTLAELGKNEPFPTYYAYTPSIPFSVGQTVVFSGWATINGFRPYLEIIEIKNGRITGYRYDSKNAAPVLAKNIIYTPGLWMRWFAHEII